MAVERDTSPELCRRAIAWYEARGRVQDALSCCWYLQDRETYRECLIRNYDKVPFLNYDKPARTEENNRTPELFYLEWMDAFLRQDTTQMKALRRYLDNLGTEERKGEEERRKITEIYLNVTYTDPEITAGQWMELLREKTDPEHPVRLYFILG